jgi:hypothetical protein
MIIDNKLVSGCKDCPFSTFSLTGGHTNFIWTGKRRIQHSCNLQKLPTQYNSKMDYSCFNTCPLKKSQVTVKLSIK